MKVARRGVLIVSWAFGWAAAVAQDAPKIEISTEFGVHSKYVWRGLELESRPNFQIGNNIRLGQLSFDVWSLSRSALPIFNAPDELDFEIRWDSEWNGLAVSPFFNVFTYPNDRATEATAEAGLSLSRETGDYVTFFDQYLDVEDASGAYFAEIGLDWQRSLSERATMGLGVSVGWGNGKFHAENYDVSRSGATVFSARAFAEIGLHRDVTLRPEIGYSRVLDRRLRNAVSGPDHVTLSLSLGFGW